MVMASIIAIVFFVFFSPPKLDISCDATLYTIYLISFITLKHCTRNILKFS